MTNADIRCNLFTRAEPFFPSSFCSSEGKFEEKEDSVPKLEQLNSLGCMTNMNLVLTKQNLLHMELLLLETFQWNLCLPTAAHFIDYYLSIAVHETDLHDGWPMVCLEKTKLYMAKYADYFLEVSLQGELQISGNNSFVLLADHVQLIQIFFSSLHFRSCIFKLCPFFSCYCMCSFFKDYLASLSNVAYSTASSHCILLGLPGAMYWTIINVS